MPVSSWLLFFCLRNCCLQKRQTLHFFWIGAGDWADDADFDLWIRTICLVRLPPKSNTRPSVAHEATGQLNGNIAILIDNCWWCYLPWLTWEIFYREDRRTGDCCGKEQICVLRDLQYMISDQLLPSQTYNLSSSMRGFISEESSMTWRLLKPAFVPLII